MLRRKHSAPCQLEYRPRCSEWGRKCRGNSTPRESRLVERQPPRQARPGAVCRAVLLLGADLLGGSEGGGEHELCRLAGARGFVDCVPVRGREAEGEDHEVLLRCFLLLRLRLLGHLW